MIRNILDTIEDQLTPVQQRQVLHAIHTVEGTQRVLCRERVRSDRSGHEFCFVQFKLTQSPQHKRSLQKLACIIAKRIRLTDEVGWYTDHSIGAILPETTISGAQIFTRDVYQTAKRHNLSISHIIFQYPNPKEKVEVEVKVTKTQFRKANSPINTLSNIPLDNICPESGRESIPYQSMHNLFHKPIPVWKRAIDIAGASFGLFISMPILFAAAVAIKITDRGPILFIQKRSGIGGKIFSMYKLRTMYIDAEKRKDQLLHLNQQDGPAFKIKNDPRITKIGKILRKTSIDEIPQLINVLKGDMSLVGPRPPTFDEVVQYESWYYQRLDVTPGITCIWQISGRSQVSFKQWMRMDAQYIKGHSFWQDMKLLLGTIPAVILRKGAY